MTFTFRIAISMLCMVALITLPGCNPMTATVTGTVTLDGEPLRIGQMQRGTVVFRPVAGGATATGLIDENGNYSLSTGGTSALRPGDYMVGVRATQLVKPDPDVPDPDTPRGNALTPLVYGNPLESGLLFTVKSGPNTYDISLDSNAGPLEPELETPVIETEDAEGDEESGETAETESAEAEPAAETDADVAAEPKETAPSTATSEAAN